VEEDVEDHHDTNIACVAGTGQKMDRAEDTTLTNRGTRQSERATREMACTTRRPGILRVVGGEQRASGAASLPGGGRSPSQGVC
jgi:hypothetical protein